MKKAIRFLIFSVIILISSSCIASREGNYRGNNRNRDNGVVVVRRHGLFRNHNYRDRDEKGVIVRHNRRYRNDNDRDHRVKVHKERRRGRHNRANDAPVIIIDKDR